MRVHKSTQENPCFYKHWNPTVDSERCMLNVLACPQSAIRLQEFQTVLELEGLMKYESQSNLTWSNQTKISCRLL